MNDNKLLYPIKYAVLRLVDEKNTIIGFIVSKCYVIEDIIKHYETGESKQYHKVVFPYTDIAYYKQKLYYDYKTDDIGIRDYPKYDLYNNIYNTYVVERLFNNYDEAYVYATINNKYLAEALISKLPWSHPNYEKEEKEISLKFSLDMVTCEKFEELILKKTKDMIVENEKESPIDLEDFDFHKGCIRILINKEFEK